MKYEFIETEKELRLPTRCKHFRPNSYPKTQKTDQSNAVGNDYAVVNDFGWSVLAQKLTQWTLKIISDQLISDHCVVGFSAEAHPMDPEKAFPTDSFPTTLRSVLQLGPTAEP